MYVKFCRTGVHVIAAVVAYSAIAASPALAQSPSGAARGPGGVQGFRAAAPSGADVAAEAKAIRLDQANAVVSMLNGKKIGFTPAQQGGKAQHAQGQVVGVLETQATGDESGLPAGTYDIFVQNVNGQFAAFAEANGQIVKQAARTTAAPGDPSRGGKPQFQAKGWCYGSGWYWTPTQWGTYTYNGVLYYYPTVWGQYVWVTVCW